MKLSARFIARFVLFFVLFFYVSLGTIFAQSTTPHPSQSAEDRDQVFTVINGLVSFTSCTLSGIDLVTRDLPCPGQENATGVGGALGLVTDTMPMFYNSPASNAEYAHYLAQNFGIAKSTYAQDSQGFTALSPVLGIWEAVRNLTYIIAVVFFILIGFGIMVRFKIDPRTVMTLQNQIPKIIIALILITFSYSIAGFMTDIMWLSTYTGLNVLGGAIDKPEVTGEATRNILNNPLNYTNDLLNTGTNEPTAPGPLKGIRDVAGGVGGFVQANVDEVVLSFLGMDDSTDCSGWWNKIASPVDCGIKAGIAWFIGVVLHAVIALVIFFAIFIALMRVWIMLLKCYIYVIIYTILGPFWILLGLLPESNFGFTNWIKSLTARLLVFPATALLFMAARIFIDGSVAIHSGGGGSQVDFIPPLVGNPNIAGGGGLGFLIAFGIIMLGPEMLTIMMDAFKRTPFKYTPAIAGGFSRGAAVPAALAGGLLAAGFKKNAQGMPGIIPFYLRQAYTNRNQGQAPAGPLRRRVTNNPVARGVGRAMGGFRTLQEGRRQYARQHNPYYPPQPPTPQGGGNNQNQGGGQGNNQGGNP